MNSDYRLCGENRLSKFEESASSNNVCHFNLQSGHCVYDPFNHNDHGELSKDASPIILPLKGF